MNEISRNLRLDVSSEASRIQIRWLEELDRTDLPEVGGKGANLGELLHAGLPVPPGFVVPAAAYRLHLDGEGLTEHVASRLIGVPMQDVDSVTEASLEIMGWIDEAPVPDQVSAAVRHAYHALVGRMSARNGVGSDFPVAVRSSATAEDLPTASFAGQQESYLNVRGAEDVLRAVRSCWASLWTPQAISYRESMGFDHTKIELAVVVQAMVPADVAGVMFTANPVSGDRDEILISASYGLGETVVSGTVTPDTYVLTTSGVVRRRTMGSKERRVVPNGIGTSTETVPAVDRNRYCLTDDELASLAGLARRVQSRYGAPQDTEWALRNGKIYLVQARPITTALTAAGPVPGTVQPASGTSEVVVPDEEPLNRGASGLARHTVQSLIEYWPEPPAPLDVSYYCECSPGMDQFFEELGAQPAETSRQPVERSDGRIAVRLGFPGLTPSIIWRLPPRIMERLRSDPMDRWRIVDAEMSSARQRWQAAEDAAQDGPALALLVAQEMRDFAYLLDRRFGAVFLSGLVHFLMVKLWARVAGGKAHAADFEDRLMRGIPFRTQLQNQAVARLAKVAGARGKESPEFRSALAGFMVEWGSLPSRGMVSMPSTPTWSEDPSQVMSLVDALLSDPAAPSSEETFRMQEEDYLAAREQVGKALWGFLRGVYRTNLDRARNGTIAREDSLFRMQTLTAFIRHTVLKLGDQLVKDAVLDKPDDIFFVLLDELLPAAEGKLVLRDRIARRKDAYARVVAAHERGQHWAVTTGTVSAEEAKGKKPKTEGQTADGNGIVGQSASRGEVTGSVRVVHGPEEFGKMQKGDVLVAPFTAPMWTPLFRLASAVVTDIGSPFSHAAIVAREYGIPAVVATENATALLSDGQRVRVDGTLGVVTILEPITGP